MTVSKFNKTPAKAAYQTSRNVDDDVFGAAMSDVAGQRDMILADVEAKIETQGIRIEHLKEEQGGMTVFIDFKVLEVTSGMAKPGKEYTFPIRGWRAENRRKHAARELNGYFESALEGAEIEIDTSEKPEHLTDEVYIQTMLPRHVAETGIDQGQTLYIQTSKHMLKSPQPDRKDHIVKAEFVRG